MSFSDITKIFSTTIRWKGLTANSIAHTKMNKYTKCPNHEFSHRQGCIFTDFHVHEEVEQVQMFMGRRLPQNPNRRICRLRNRNDFFLTIAESGEIMGTKNVKDVFSK